VMLLFLLFFRERSKTIEPVELARS